MKYVHVNTLRKVICCSIFPFLISLGFIPDAFSRTPKTDGEIQGAVFKRMEMDSRVNTENLGVNVEEGHVKIFGLVDSLKEKHIASNIASSVDGVNSILNTIRVKSDIDEDRRIRMGIEQLVDIAKLPITDTFAVKVMDGTVTLEGAVPNRKTKNAIQVIAENRPGVVEVKNLLAVTGISRKDLEIYQDIVFYLRWSPFFKQDDIQVEVDHGIVKLRGQIDYLAERIILAQDLKNIQGVEKVDVDNLTLEPNIALTENS